MTLDKIIVWQTISDNKNDEKKNSEIEEMITITGKTVYLYIYIYIIQLMYAKPAICPRR